MGKPVVMGALLQCSMGVAPSSFTVTDPSRPLVENKPAGVITDNAPMSNILPFGMCNSLANPTVAAATSAALGVLTPQPCIPATAAPWMPGSISVTIGGKPALTDTCTLMCNWAGVIKVQMPGSMSTTVA